MYNTRKKHNSSPSVALPPVVLHALYTLPPVALPPLALPPVVPSPVMLPPVARPPVPLPPAKIIRRCGVAVLSYTTILAPQKSLKH